VNIVGDLVNDDAAVNNGRVLCGFVYAGCGSGKEFAETKARGMFDVLCASLARVLVSFFFSVFPFDFFVFIIHQIIIFIVREQGPARCAKDLRGFNSALARLYWDRFSPGRG
jgi:hypothetical protein